MTNNEGVKMKHSMIRCDGTRGFYYCECNCGEKFSAEYLSDLLFSYRKHRDDANQVTSENVISIFTRRPLPV